MFSRRTLLRSVASAGALPFIGSAAGIDPPKRIGPPVYKFSLAAYSLRDRLDLSKKPTLDLLGFLDLCCQHRLHGAELTSYYFPPQTDDKSLMELKLAAHLRGLGVSGGAVRNDFCQVGPKLEADKRHVDEWCRRYGLLGAPAVRVFAGDIPKGQSAGECILRCSRELQAASERAGHFGIMIALENHGGITSRPEAMLEIIRGVNSPWFGVNLDGGNFRDGPDPYADLAVIAPFAVNVQIKVDMHRTVNGVRKHEPVDMKLFASILREARYTGWIVLEYEGAEDPSKGIPRALDAMRSAFV